MPMRGFHPAWLANPAFWQGLAGIVGFFAVWALARRIGWLVLPGPGEVAAGLPRLVSEPTYWLSWAGSAQRVFAGFAIAAIHAVALGLAMGISAKLRLTTFPVLELLRPIPPLAWLPLSLAAFRDGEPSAIFVIFITAIWPVIINTAVGIRNIPQDYRNVAAVLRLNHLEFFWKIMVPSAAPYIFTGLRIGIGLSWLAIVAAEMLIGGVGIGFFIWDAWNSSHISEIILALVYVGVIGFVLDRIVAALANIVTRGTAAN